MSSPSSSLSPSSMNVLTGEGGFSKLPLQIENENTQKMRLYRLDRQSPEQVEAAKAALERKVEAVKGEYKNAWNSFPSDIKTSPYLLREGQTFRLLSHKEGLELQLKYGLIGPQAKEKSQNILQILEDNKVQTDEQLVEFYNHSTPAIQDALLPLINELLLIFSKERPILEREEVKTLTLLGQCARVEIQGGALNTLFTLFKNSEFKEANYGFGLKYLLDQMSEKFFQQNQLLLLDIFNALSEQLDGILHSARSVNHEIEPLLAALNAVGRALVRSHLEKLNKETKDVFYARLKSSCHDEVYSKRMEALTSRKNYLLVHSFLWILQHLVRITSSEHKVVTALRKTCHGLLTAKLIIGTPFKAWAQFMHGEIADEEIVHDLKAAYKHGKKAFGFKDLPRPWYDMLEQTEPVLLNPQLTESNFDELYKRVQEYEEVRHSFNALIHNQLKFVPQETKEFTFGFVGQLTHVAMDHPQAAVQLKALETLGEIFNKKEQSEDVRVFILTALQNILDQQNLSTLEPAKALQTQLHQREPKLAKEEIFRQSKYPCLALLPGDSQLLNAAKAKLKAASQGDQPLPTSEFVYGSRDKRVYKKAIKVKKFAPKGSQPLTSEELKNVVEASKAIHAPLLEVTSGQASTRTKAGNKTTTIFEGEIDAEEFNG